MNSMGDFYSYVTMLFYQTGRKINVQTSTERPRQERPGIWGETSGSFINPCGLRYSIIGLV